MSTMTLCHSGTTYLLQREAVSLPSSLEALSEHAAVLGGLLLQARLEGDPGQVQCILYIVHCIQYTLLNIQKGTQ